MKGLKGSYNATCTFTSCLNWNVCWQGVYTTPYNGKNPPSVSFFLNLYRFLKSSHLSVWHHTDEGCSLDSLFDSSILAQTALVSYLRPALSELSSVVSPPEQM